MERRVQSATLLFVQRFAVRLFGDTLQHFEKPFDAAVAIAQHPDRVREIALPPGSNDDGHEFSSLMNVFLTAGRDEDRRRVPARRAAESDSRKSFSIEIVRAPDCAWMPTSSEPARA